MQLLKDRILTDGVVKEGNVLKAYAVKVGITNGIRTQILSGISQGAEIITGSKAQAEMGEEANAGDDGERSPFAPGPRGKNNKKGK